MKALKDIIAACEKANACEAQLNGLKAAYESGDIVSAWATLMYHKGWLGSNNIPYPDNLEELAEKQGKSWHDNGNLEGYCYYENGKLHGEWKWFYDNGTLEVHSYYEHGKRHGECKWYYEDGTLMEHSYYENGNQHGEYKWFYDNGTLREHSYYKHGNLIKRIA